MRTTLPAVLLLAVAFVPCIASAAVATVPVQPFYFERLHDSAYLARIGATSLLLEKGAATVSRGEAVVHLGFASASVPQGAGLLPSRSERT